MKPITWRGKLKRDMDETTKKFIDEGNFDAARKHMSFASLMRKGIDIDWGFVFIVIGLSMIIVTRRRFKKKDRPDSHGTGRTSIRFNARDGMDRSWNR